MKERAGSSAAVRASASLIIGDDLAVLRTRNALMHPTQCAQMARGAFERQRVDACIARDVSLREARQCETPIVKQRLPIHRVTEIDPQARRIRKHARADFRSVAPATKLD